MPQISRKSHPGPFGDSGGSNATSTYYISAKSISSDIGVPLSTQVDMKTLLILTGVDTSGNLTLGSKRNHSMMSLHTKSVVITATSISLSRTTMGFGNTGGTDTLTATPSPSTGTFLLANVPSWLSFVPTFGNGVTSFTFLARDNSTFGYPNQSQTINFVGANGVVKATLPVTLAGNPAVETITPTADQVVNSSAGTSTIVLTLSNQLTISPAASINNTTGFTLTGPTKSVGSTTTTYTYTLTRTANGFSGRETTFTVNYSGSGYSGSRTRKFTQEALTATVDLVLANTDFAQGGQTKQVTINSNCDWTVSISGTGFSHSLNNSSWVTSQLTGTGNDILYVKADSNGTITPRTGTSSIIQTGNSNVSDGLTYNQTGLGEFITTTLPDGTDSWTASGDGDNIQVNIDTENAWNTGWTMYFSQNWLGVQAGSSTTGTGDGSVVITATQNSSTTNSRSATVTVYKTSDGINSAYKDTISVTQSARSVALPSISTSTSKTAFLYDDTNTTSEYATFTINVTSNETITGVKFSLDNANAKLITTTTTTAANNYGNQWEAVAGTPAVGTFTTRVIPTTNNTGTTDRTITVRAQATTQGGTAYEDVDFTQYAQGSFVLGALTTFAISPTAQGLTVNVTPDGVPLQVYASVSWIQLSSTQTGTYQSYQATQGTYFSLTGDGTIWIKPTVNSSTARSGTLTIRNTARGMITTKTINQSGQTCKNWKFTMNSGAYIAIISYNTCDGQSFGPASVYSSISQICLVGTPVATSGGTWSIVSQTC